VGRRHPDVQDDDVGRLRVDDPQEALGVAGLADDLEPRARERGRQRLPQEVRVVGEGDAHVRIVPSPIGRRTGADPRIASRWSGAGPADPGSSRTDACRMQQRGA
jgi:hypothetical protein